MRGMVVDGISIGTSSAVAVSGSSVATANGYSEGVSCRPPRTEAERCDISVGAAGAAPKADWQDVRGRNVFISLAYFVFLIPGVIASAVYVGGEHDAEAAAAKAGALAQASCDARADREVVELKPEHTERKVVAATHPLYCTLDVDNTQAGACFLTTEKCEQYVTDSRSKPSIKVSYTDCVERNTGSCFNFNETLSGKRGVACAPSITSCEFQLASFATNPDFEITAKQCGIYRYEPDGADGE